MFVSVKICDILEFVKRLFKVLAQFNDKTNQYLGRRVHPKNGDQIQYLIKIGAETKSFVCNYARWKPKHKKDPCFAQVRYLLTKLCNIFDDVFLFDVSIQAEF